jgi:hypothetical protein
MDMYKDGNVKKQSLFHFLQQVVQFLRPTANTSLIFAGAIFDPETSSNPNNIFAEQDGRLYGVIGNGRTGGITDRFPINSVQILNINGSLGTVSHISLPGANNGGLSDTALLKIHAQLIQVRRSIQDQMVIF